MVEDVMEVGDMVMIGYCFVCYIDWSVVGCEVVCFYVVVLWMLMELFE